MHQALESVSKAGVRLRSQARQDGEGRLAIMSPGSPGHWEVTGKQSGRQEGAELTARMVAKNTGIEGKLGSNPGSSPLNLGFLFCKMKS